ncbi:MAG TPA: hypothetical protein VJK03_04985 [Candidatus Nanoarchaeia archaeon]|nr:hypothetical protein [Candidatus Nanoarchaeia archaeon]
MRNLYHYTSAETADAILNGESLEPRSAICIPDLPKVNWFIRVPAWANKEKKYLFCFLDDPRTSAWSDGAVVQRLFEYIDSPRIALLRFTVEGATRRAHVLEGNLVREMAAFNTGIANGRIVINPYRCVQNYLDSRVALTQYRGNYVLPEVIFQESVPSESVSLVEMKNP